MVFLGLLMFFKNLGFELKLLRIERLRFEEFVLGFDICIIFGVSFFLEFLNRRSKFFLGSLRYGR